MLKTRSDRRCHGPLAHSHRGQSATHLDKQMPPRSGTADCSHLLASPSHDTGLGFESEVRVVELDS